jgi:hypothetical protein
MHVGSSRVVPGTRPRPECQRQAVRRLMEHAPSIRKGQRDGAVLREVAGRRRSRTPQIGQRGSPTHRAFAPRRSTHRLRALRLDGQAARRRTGSASRAQRNPIARNQLDVRLLDFGDQPVDGEHEFVSVPIGAVRQQCAGMCHEHVIAPGSRPALHLGVAHMREAGDITGTPRMPKGREHVFERELDGARRVHVAVQHNSLHRARESIPS